jgi:hypothetical protein
MERVPDRRPVYRRGKSTDLRHEKLLGYVALAFGAMNALRCCGRAGDVTEGRPH